jgi:ribosome maturation factor RimP
VSALRSRLVPLLEPVVAGVGADLEDVTVTSAGRRSVVRVVVDADGGISLDDVAEVSRVVSEALDELDARDPAAFSGTYVLEVSSPGVDRPLTAPRHWRRSEGRLVKAVLHEGGEVTGRVLRADDDGAVLDVAGGERELAYAQVARAAVQVEFSRQEVSDA